MASPLRFPAPVGKSRVISDWGLWEELAEPLPRLAVGFIDRNDPASKAFTTQIDELSTVCGHLFEFRIIDVGENPTIRWRYELFGLPALVLYVGGSEHTRWECTLDVGRVVSVIAAVTRNPEGKE